MLDNEKDEFMRLITETAELYGKTLSAGVIRMYWEDLKYYSFFNVKNAIMQYRRRETRDDRQQPMPKPSDLIALAKKNHEKERSRNKVEVAQCCQFKDEGKICGVIEKGLFTVQTDAGVQSWCHYHWMHNHPNPEMRQKLIEIVAFIEGGEDRGLTPHQIAIEMSKACKSKLDSKIISKRMEETKEIIAKQNALYANAYINTRELDNDEM